jgi:mannosyltransferase OCH1-like enzyme
MTLNNDIGKIPRRVKPRSSDCPEQSIPRTIHQTWISDDYAGPDMKEAVAGWIRLNPDYEYRFYDNDDCEQFILDQYGQRFLDAYLTINPIYGAARADLFRYLLLFKLGGVYADIDHALLLPLSKFVKPYDEYVSGSGRQFPNQAMIISIAGHPILKTAVNLALDTIESFINTGLQPRSQHPGTVFGPGLLSQAFVETMMAVENDQAFQVRKLDGQSIHMNWGGRVSFKYKNVHAEMHAVRPHWGSVYNNSRLPLLIR